MKTNKHYNAKVSKIMKEFQLLIGSVADTVLARVCMETRLFPEEIKTNAKYLKLLHIMEKEFSAILGKPIVKRIIRGNK